MASYLGKICEMTCIQHDGISQWIRISQFRFTSDKGHTFRYILCNVGEDWSTKPQRLCREFLYLLRRDGKNRHIIPNISASTKPNFTNFSDYKTEIIFAVDRECCYGNRFILGPFCTRQNWPSLLFALAFPNKMQHRFVNERINSYTNASTSCEILVKIGAVTSEFKRAKTIKICRDPAAIWLSLLFGTLAFWNGLEYQIFDFSEWSATISVHLVKIWWWRISDRRVLDERSCTAGVDNCYHT